ncbi:hypothetical protein K7J14_07280 [Treponema zuelzerae]|uniref:Uncharacterized protein n=1 Tax=Teretinema zuelzerae TaxID=156 RepID=A0AAE3JIR7_9SPIR|nr:hypothetical protein [Teretinema zuelzerae]MCD1654506.1 hypothetical protein [Teretinema zuelzerae]
MGDSAKESVKSGVHGLAKVLRMVKEEAEVIVAAGNRFSSLEARNKQKKMGIGKQAVNLLRRIKQKERNDMHNLSKN